MKSMDHFTKVLGVKLQGVNLSHLSRELEIPSTLLFEWAVGYTNTLTGNITLKSITENQSWSKELLGWKCNLLPKHDQKIGEKMRALLCTKNKASIAIKVTCSKEKQVNAH